MEMNSHSAQDDFVEEAEDDFEVLMDGSKRLWKLSLSLDILIVSHPGHMCYEVAAYNSAIGVEAPRIYISSVLLAEKVNCDRTEFEEKLKEAQEEVFLRKRKTCKDAYLRKQVYNELVVSYIMRRLSVVKDIDLTKELRVELSRISPRSCISSIRSRGVCDEARQQTQGDKNQDVLCSMPPNLQPVKATFSKIAR
jgi:hypothetical protein